MVTVVARWKVKPGVLPEVVELAEALAHSSRQEKGCMIYDVYLKHQDTDRVLIFETYKSMEDFEFHKNTPHFKDLALGQIIPLLEERELSVFEDKSL